MICFSGMLSLWLPLSNMKRVCEGAIKIKKLNKHLRVQFDYDYFPYLEPERCGIYMSDAATFGLIKRHTRSSCQSYNAK